MDRGEPHFSVPRQVLDEESTATSTARCSLNPKVMAIVKPVYPALAAHQRSEEDWKHRELAVWLDEWWDRFVAEFGLEIPRTALRLEENLRRNCLGYFRPGYNEFGLKMEIAIGVPSLADWDRLDHGDLLGTLLHEQLHLAQEIHGKPSPHNHHNREFRDRAAGYGLLVDYRGHQVYALTSRFLDMLRRHGVKAPRILSALSSFGGGEVGAVPAKPVRVPGNSKLKKWSCGCTNVRVAVAEFAALCLRCNRPFVRSD